MVVVTHEMGFARTRGEPRGVHGRRPDRRGEHSRGVLHQRPDGSGQGLPFQDSYSLTARSPLFQKRRGSKNACTSYRSRWLIAAAAAASLTACGGSGSGSDKFVVGIKFDQPGFGQKQPDGSYKGFDVDVAKYIAKELGYTDDKIEYKEAISANRESFLQQGQVNAVIATYSITDDRKKKVSFAGPYLVTGQDILTRADDTTIASVEDLKDKKVCGAQGSSSPQASWSTSSARRWKDQSSPNSRGLRRLSAPAGEQAGRRDLHGRDDPRRLRHPVSRQVPASSASPSPRRSTASASRWTTRRPATRSTRLSRRCSRTAAGRRPSTPTSASSGRSSPPRRLSSVTDRSHLSRGARAPRPVTTGGMSAGTLR